MFIYNSICCSVKGLPQVIPAAPSLESSEYAARAPDAVFFVGDSITFGWRDEDLGGWPSRLIAALPAGIAVTGYNLGVRGDTSEEIRARWSDEVARRHRESANTVVVFAFVANDAKLSPDQRPLVSLDRIAENARQILLTAKRRHTVLFVGPAPVEEAALARAFNRDGTAAVPSNAQVEAVSEVLSATAAEVSVPYYDLSRQLKHSDDWLEVLRETDGIHPPARGHDLIAAMLLAWPAWKRLFPRRGG